MLQRESNFLPILQKTLNFRAVKELTLDRVGSYKWQSQSSGPGLPVSRVRKTPALLSTPQHPDIQYCGIGIARMTPHSP